MESRPKLQKHTVPTCCDRGGWPEAEGSRSAERLALHWQLWWQGGRSPVQLQGAPREKAAQNLGVRYTGGRGLACCTETPLTACLRHGLAGLGPGAKHTFPDRTAT